jgi:hypothetical protein
MNLDLKEISMIVAAAYWNKIGPGVYYGINHGEICQKNPHISFDENFIDGFITDDGLFLDRFQAAEHAIKHNQIKELKFPKMGLDSSEIDLSELVKYQKFESIYRVIHPWRA